MELYICDADGSNMKQLTNLGNANWSPFLPLMVKKYYSQVILRLKEAFHLIFT
jgi:hypothetical protein